MSNTERHPQEHVCENRTYTRDGLSPGITVGENTVEVLEPREVPLGGPRAMGVRRTLPQRARSLVGAWCFLDFYGPDDVARTGGMAVPRHPHTGLATVSWLFSGAIDHIDSAGNWALVRPGDAVFMNAGRGITHSEHSTEETTVLHGAQFWYALPHEHRFVAPHLDIHRPDPVGGDGWQARVFVGELLGARSEIRPYIPLSGAELRLEPGTVLDVAVPADHEHALLRVEGDVRFEGQHLPADHLGVVDVGRDRLRIEAGDEPVLALLFGGEPLDEQIVMWWNFVGRSHEDIVAYRAAYQAEMGFEAPLDDHDGSAGTAADRQFGDFPSHAEAPLPAPQMPGTRLKPRR
ncbi:MAG: pirin family protein [Nesterenkonia sp.]|nr:pirin family protein [Nesterenkonia sp.]